MNDVSTTWTAVAGAWDDNAEFVETIKAPVTARLLQLLDLRPGERVLELGAGPGLLGYRLAGLVGPSGRVVVSDIAPGMVDRARRRLRAETAVEAVRLDAAAIELADRSQDAVVFRMGLMLVDDPVAAVAEIRRVLADGGRFGAAVWAGPEHNPWLSSVGIAAMMHGLVRGGPPVGPGGVFSLADPELLGKVVEASGFEDVVVETVEVVVPFDTVDAWFSHLTSMAGPLVEAFASATADQLTAVRATVAELARPFVRPAGGFELPGRATIAFARR